MATLDRIALASKQYIEAAAKSDFVDYVDSTLRYCCKAVEILQERLREIGYPVSRLITPPPKGLSRHIERIESHTGLEIPALLKQIWSVVGGLSFVDLDTYSHVEFWEGQGVRGKKGFCDGVHIDSCTTDWLKFTISDFDELKDEGAEDDFYYSISPDGYHKDDISGGDSYGVKHGQWMPELLNFNWSGVVQPSSSRKGESVDLMAYLRTSILECAGFPGLLGDKTFEPIRQRLTDQLPVF
jgi:hypothetical protein